MLKRNILITTATFLCFLALFGMTTTALAPVFIPPDSASIITPEGVAITESFTGPATSNLYEDCKWILRIEITPTVSDIDNVLVEETLSAEIEVNEIKFVSHGAVDANPMGSKPDKSAIYITWTIDVLPLGHMAYIELEISTDLNPSGKQEYTSCGCYYLNSGIRLTYYIGNIGYKYSDWNWVWEVCVPCEDIPLFTDVLRILPLATLSGALVVFHRRRR